MKYSFENLEVWQKSREFVKEFLQEAQLTELRTKIDQIDRMLNALYQSAHKPINLSTHQP